MSTYINEFFSLDNYYTLYVTSHVLISCYPLCVLEGFFLIHNIIRIVWSIWNLDKYYFYFIFWGSQNCLLIVVHQSEERLDIITNHNRYMYDPLKTECVCIGRNILWLMKTLNYAGKSFGFFSICWIDEKNVYGLYYFIASQYFLRKKLISN